MSSENPLVLRESEKKCRHGTHLVPVSFGNGWYNYTGCDHCESDPDMGRAPFKPGSFSADSPQNRRPDSPSERDYPRPTLDPPVKPMVDYPPYLVPQKPPMDDVGGI